MALQSPRQRSGRSSPTSLPLLQLQHPRLLLQPTTHWLRLLFTLRRCTVSLTHNLAGHTPRRHRGHPDPPLRPRPPPLSAVLNGTRPVGPARLVLTRRQPPTLHPQRGPAGAAPPPPARHPGPGPALAHLPGEGRVRPGRFPGPRRRREAAERGQQWQQPPRGPPGARARGLDRRSAAAPAPPHPGGGGPAARLRWRRRRRLRPGPPAAAAAEPPSHGAADARPARLPSPPPPPRPPRAPASARPAPARGGRGRGGSARAGPAGGGAAGGASSRRRVQRGQPRGRTERPDK